MSKTLSIAFIGGPSTGKTTLAKTLTDKLCQQGLNAGYVKEFVTEDIQQNGVPNLANIGFEQIRFYLKQSAQENEVKAHCDYMVTESPTYFSYIYALEGLLGNTDKRQQLALDILRDYTKQNSQRYDFVFYLKRELPYEDNGIRFHTEEQAKQVDNRILDVLESFDINYHVVSGSVEQRCEQVLTALNNSDKKSSQRTA